MSFIVEKILEGARYAATDSHPSGIALAMAYTPHSHPRSRYAPYGGWARVHYDGPGGWGAGCGLGQASCQLFR